MWKNRRIITGPPSPSSPALPASRPPENASSPPPCPLPPPAPFPTAIAPAPDPVSTSPPLRIPDPHRAILSFEHEDHPAVHAPPPDPRRPPPPFPPAAAHPRSDRPAPAPARNYNDTAPTAAALLRARNRTMRQRNFPSPPESFRPDPKPRHRRDRFSTRLSVRPPNGSPRPTCATDPE